MGTHRTVIRQSVRCAVIYFFCSLLIAGTSEDRLKSVHGPDRVRVLNELAFDNTSRSKDQAMAYANEALLLARSSHDRKGEGDSLRGLAIATDVGGEHEKAIQLGERALVIFREIKDFKAEGRLLNHLGVFHRGLSHYDKALDYSRQAKRIAEDLHDDEGRALALNNIGDCLNDQGSFLRGLEAQKEALPIHQRLGLKSQEANTENSIGIGYFRLGDYEKAMESSLLAAQIHHGMGNKAGECAAMSNVGSIHLFSNQPKLAEESYQRALTLAKEVGDEERIAGLLINLGNVQILSNHPDIALKQFQESLERFQKLRDRSGMADATSSLGLALQHQARFRESLPHHLEALALYREIGNKRGEANALNNIGRVMVDLKDYRKAEDYLKQGLAAAQAIQEKKLIRDSYEGLVNLFESRGDTRKALEYIKCYIVADREMVNEKTSQRLTGLKERYESEKKDQAITLLEQEKKLLKREGQLQRWRFFGILSGLLVVLGILALLFKRYLHLLAFWRRKHQIGRYLLGDRIGSGGLGIVYRASDITRKSGAVAIKIIREEFSNDPVLTRRLKHEAILIDQLNHPNIVKVYERGEHDQQIYIVMELLQGRSMADVLREGPMAISSVLSIGIQLANTLAAIHSKGIIHRDLKPENVMLLEQENGPQVKLLDFDIAVSTNLTRLTETGRIMGTLHYIPPEQITHQKVLAAGDIYSLGVLLYEALTGMKPFPAELPTDIIRQILGTEPIPPKLLRPGTPDELNSIILAMLFKDPSLRPDEQALQEQLRRIGEPS